MQARGQHGPTNVTSTLEERRLCSFSGVHIEFWQGPLAGPQLCSRRVERLCDGQLLLAGLAIEQEQLDPAQPGHFQIEQDDIRRIGADDGKGLLAIFGDIDQISPLSKEAAEHVSDAGLVIHNEDPGAFVN
jgi:hypothetical protein